jgi:hypothetical protein
MGEKYLFREFFKIVQSCGYSIEVNLSNLKKGNLKKGKYAKI